MSLHAFGGIALPLGFGCLALARLFTGCAHSRLCWVPDLVLAEVLFNRTP